jgi:hypothetical protein
LGVLETGQEKQRVVVGMGELTGREIAIILVSIIVNVKVTITV